MNERIKKLLEQCTDQHMTKPWPLIDAEKFAELIVQECVHALWTEECRTNAMVHADYERGGNRIHKHFWS
jgi:hypothetical protein